MWHRPIPVHPSLVLPSRVLPIVRPLREGHQNGGGCYFFHPQLFFISGGTVFVEKLQEVLFVHLDEKGFGEEEEVGVGLRHPYFLLLL